MWQQRPQYKWSSCEPLAEEMAAAEKEAVSPNAFDRLQLKATVWNAWKAGAAKLVCKEYGPLARVVVLLPAGAAEPDWAIWERIFMWFGAAANGQPWKVTLFAAQTPRQFPGLGQDLGPEHVNGGYTQPCSTTGIYIYRQEEATRVLIHELLHAACLDEPDWSIPMREAMIETWAELILIALKAKGTVVNARRLWAAQGHWVADTNWRAKHMHNAHDLSDYGWRYLSGREDMYRRLGAELPAPRRTVAEKTVSLRFTHPLLDM